MRNAIWVALVFVSSSIVRGASPPAPLPERIIEAIKRDFGDVVPVRWLFYKPEKSRGKQPLVGCQRSSGDYAVESVRSEAPVKKSVLGPKEALPSLSLSAWYSTDGELCGYTEHLDANSGWWLARMARESISSLNKQASTSCQLFQISFSKSHSEAKPNVTLHLSEGFGGACPNRFVELPIVLKSFNPACQGDCMIPLR